MAAQLQPSTFFNNNTTISSQTTARTLENGIPHGNRFRHVTTPAAFNQYLDSSESLPSEHGSLCRAILVSFESEHDHCNPAHHEDTVDNSSRSPFCTSQSVATESVRPSWQANGIRTVTRLPVPRPVSSSPDLTKSYNLRSSRTFKGVNPNLRVFAFDDLDIPTSRPKFQSSLFPSADRRPTSSSGSFETLNWLNETRSPAEPSLPILPPLVRSPTPPGLPSFGSPEAVNYSLPSRSRDSGIRFNQHDGRSDRLPRHSATEGDPDSAIDWCIFGFRRLFCVPSYATPSQSRLPPGVIARAEDGTYIRGRFGNRQSGHGVGAGPLSRGLECHPFHSSPLATVSTADAAGTDAVGRNGVSVNRSGCPTYRRPPYSSLLDVPSPSKPPPPRRVRFADNPESATAPNTTGPLPSHATRRNSEPYLPVIPERAASAHPTGYSSPLGMQLSTDGEGDGRDAASATSSFRAEGAGFQSFSWVTVRSATTVLWKRIRTGCLSGCCADEENNLLIENLPPGGDGGNRGGRTITDPQSDNSHPPSKIPTDRTRERRCPSVFSTPWMPAWGWYPFSGG